MMIELVAVATLMTGMDPEGVVTTAPRGDQAVLSATADMAAATVTNASPSTTVQSAAPHGLTTDQQIARWIGARTAETASAPQAWADPWEEPEPRKVHGMVSAGFGTGGYRDYAATVSMPLGESGMLNLSISQTKNAPWSYGYYGSPWGHGAYGRSFDAAEPWAYGLAARPYHGRMVRERTRLQQEDSKADSPDAGR
ncbi:hypothetical protein ACFPIF_02380 [Brevundimonas faecalis]|uniref:hypothetical protein n=1 Tax=Brevundimonas faecalis TaxID=947378 RepID=UPI003611174C